MDFAHTCYRITDIDTSLEFYVDGLGLSEIRRAPIRDEAINVFLGADDGEPRLELTWNRDQDGPYEIGTGYGHAAFIVDDIDATLESLADKGITPEKPPYQVREGGSRLCFVRDPDGYRVELIERS